MDFLSIATRRRRDRTRRDRRSFNSVVDFLSIATRIQSDPASNSQEPFQFRRGFSVYCNVSVPTTSNVMDTFQFRRGFSVYCNEPRGGHCRHNVDLFQFRRGFSVYCNGCRIKPAASWSCCFNSVVDFLSIATALSCFGARRRLSFQFRRGFSVYCNRPQHQNHLIYDVVSIPSWIFCLLQHCRRPAKLGFCRVSIPSWIFCLLQLT